MSIRIVKRIIFLTDILVKISTKCFILAYRFVLFLSALCGSIGGAVSTQSLSILHLFKFFVVRQVFSPVVGSRFYFHDLYIYFHNNENKKHNWHQLHLLENYNKIIFKNKCYKLDNFWIQIFSHNRYSFGFSC